ncbi:MAG: CBS domain-containing protein [Planctomycetes bacterium]|nr:CBS domain-containing protein [Planctomycetota bacterium]
MTRRHQITMRECMSRLPHELEVGATVAEASEAMTKGGFRHLPIMDGPRLFGLVTRHDLDQLLAARGPEAAQLTVNEVCLREVYTISPEAELVDAVREMRRRKIGSVLVKDAGLVIGIFTSSDALRVLADLL